MRALDRTLRLSRRERERVEVTAARIKSCALIPTFSHLKDGRRSFWNALVAAHWIFLGMALTSPLHAEPHAYFSNHDDVQGALKEAIDGTRQSLDAALFEMTSPVLSEALARAAARGVNVRLIFDSKHRPEGLEEIPTGMEIRYLGGRSRRHRGLMHDKFAIFDEEQVVTGSFNWTPGAQYSNYENALMEDDTQIVHAFADQFKELWDKATPTPKVRVRVRFYGGSSHE